MKRVYIKPTTTSYDVETEQLMTASLTFDNAGKASVTLGNEGATTDAMSKGHSFSVWGDDDDE